MRLDKSTVSVIIPSYNRAAYLVQAIKSVLDQQRVDGFDVEILVVDDGSTDSTHDTLKKQFKDKITFIPLLHSGDPAAVRNAGLKHAKGRYVAFLDSDDLWEPTKLAQMLPLFNADEVVLAYSQADVIDTDGNPTDQTVVEDKDLAKGESLRGLLETNVISTSTVIARKDALLEVGGFHEGDVMRGVEDYNLWLKTILRHPKGVRMTPKSLTKYRVHEHNISNTDAVEALRRIINAHQDISQVATDQKQASLIEEQVIADHKSLNSQLAQIHGKPAISVVMSVYNGEKLLRPAIDSILSQTLKNIEFIIINDGSTDSTQDILESYNDPRLRIINQKNHGLVYSLNKGFRIAHAEFVARMDADDLSAPSRLERELTVITANPSLALVGTYFTYIDEDDNFLNTTIAMPTKDVDVKRALYVTNPFAHGSMLIRKQAWREAGGYTDTYGPTEDYKLWSDIINDGRWTTAIIPESLYWYRISPGSISHQKRDIQHHFSKKIADERWDHPFVYKSMRTIVRDGHAYKRGLSPYAITIFDNYKHQQLAIMRQLFLGRHFLTGLKAAIGLSILVPRWAPLTISRSVAGGFMRKIGLKS